MPEYTDSSGAKLSMDVNLQEAKTFLKFQDGFIIYELGEQLADTGDYNIKYSITSNGETKSFQFTVRVTSSEFYIADYLEKKYVPPSRPVINVSNPPRPYIDSINNSGLIKIAFS